MSAFISGGTATFEQSRKLAEYENRKVSITFNVQGAEGQDAGDQVTLALQVAKDMVLRELGLSAVPRETFEQKVVEGKIAPKKTALKKPPLPAGDTPLEKAISSTLEPTQKTLVEIQTANQAKGDPAGFDNDPFTASVPAVTDKEISDAVGRKNDALIKASTAGGKDGALGTKLIKDLIASYGVKTMREIPQGVRKEFMAKLEALA